MGLTSSNTVHGSYFWCFERVSSGEMCYYMIQDI
jgi:hypothetical protein